MNNLIQALHFDESPAKQIFLLKEIATLLPYAKKVELQELLRMLSSTPDTDLQVKIFSILSAHIISKAANVDVIIAYRSLYDKAQIILSGGLPRRMAPMLNFLSAILYTDDDSSRKRSLLMYARNMIRVSGCLATMCEIFTNCMMYQDTWKSLCMCLSECCRGSGYNQSYCTHLIPMSIQRCIQGDKDVFLVLQSVLQNHERNTKLFFDSDGASIFNSQLLQYEPCMQLLDTVVQNSPSAAMSLCNTGVVEHLRGFLHQYAPNTQLGQWASIVLYHIDSQVKVLAQGPEKLRSCEQFNGKAENMIDNNKRNDSSEVVNLENTTTLLQNVIKEVFRCRTMDKSAQDIPVISVEPEKRIHRHKNGILPIIDKPFHINTQTRAHKLINNAQYNPAKLGNVKSVHVGKDLSFSFLRNKGIQTPVSISEHVAAQNEVLNKSGQIIGPNYETMRSLTLNSLLVKTQETLHTRDNCSRNNTGLKSFKPLFMSTPKSKSKAIIKSTRSNQTPFRCLSSSLSVKTKRETTIGKPLRKMRQEVNRCTKETKQRSLSNRVLCAINESCTTIVKSVRNLFMSRPNDTLQMANTTNLPNRNIDPPCTYSFTNYMRKRDAIEMLSAQNSDSSNAERNESTPFNSDVMSCKTCNDTKSLKNKFISNNCLKQTVKKLKLGINLYGCDFKKISKSLWPQETYMTPEVLYNLYRKLIIK